MNNDDLTTAQGFALVGILLLLIIPVATALALWLKQRYAQAVVRLQAETARAVVDSIEETAPDARLLRAGGSVAQRAATVAPPPAVAPALHAHHAVDVQRSAADPARTGRRLRAKVLGVQLLFGTLYWVTMLIMVAAIFAYLNEADQAAAPAAAVVEPSAWTTAMGHLAVWPLLLAPPLLAWAIQAGTRTRWLWWGFALSLVCVGVGSLASGSLNMVEAATSVAVLAVLGIMLLAFMRPAVRGAGPPLVAAITVAWLTLCALFGAALLIEKMLEGDTPNADEAVTAAEWFVGIALLAIMVGASAWAGWRTLPRLALHYAQKRYSEVQLALGAYWALITAHGVGLVLMATFDDKQPNAEAFTLAVVLLVMWWLWRWTQRLALRWTVFGFKRTAPPALPPMLLLRVFKPSARSEDFMDRFLARWRFVAPVWMIAGPDLAGAYMEPDEFFAFVDRSLAERFITRAEQVPARLAELDNQRDPDGRFRVNDLYCANTTWKTTVLAMIERAGVIVLDLREYTRQRAGTRFELRELLTRAPLSKVVVLVDEHDDMAALQSEIDTLWQELANAGHARSRPGDLAIVTLGPDSDRQLRGLVDAVAEAAARH
jgi:hypothetical protein